jgi:hypothetical protein
MTASLRTVGVQSRINPVHINPDHFLQTEHGRVITPERNKAAWEQSYEAFANALHARRPSTKVYVLVGPQGAGKSTWAKSHASRLPDAIFFDAILVKRIERAPVLSIAKAHAVAVVAVWFQTPLELCIARNAARPIDEVVPEQAIRNVYAAVEPPSADEGFEHIIEVPP